MESKKKANLTYDGEPGAWAKIPLLRAHSPSPAGKLASAQPSGSWVPVPGSSAGRGPGAQICPPCTTGAFHPTLPPAPWLTDTHPAQSAACQPQSSGRHLQNTALGLPTKPQPRCPRSPSTRSRVPGPKYWVSESRPPNPVQNPSPPCIPPCPGVPSHLAPSARCLGQSAECFDSQPKLAAQKWVLPPSTLSKSLTPLRGAPGHHLAHLALSGGCPRRNTEGLCSQP